ncbi:MAG: Beta-lactamase-like protein [Holophagaceae bacterium]|nr:Beta-lactamase-like protein [Holophagaceae bacterium]
MRSSLLLSACLLACPPSLRAEDAVDVFMRAQMAQAHIPGAAVAVIRGGRLEKLAAYGTASLESGAPVTPDTPFQIASATKLYTGVLLMQLVEEGKVDLDTPISTYLGEVPPAWRPITVRHLAAHAAGLKPQMVGAHGQDLAQVLKAAQAVPLAAAPGAVSAYGSDDFSVLALILEKAGGRPFSELLRERVWKPLGMTRTGFEDVTLAGNVRTAEVVPGRASVYQWRGDRQRLHWYAYPPHTYAAGGAFTSLRDEAAFLLALDQGCLLSARGREALWTPFRLNDGRTAGFGVAWSVGTLAGRPCAGHSGGPALSDVLYFPKERLGVIVFTNQQRLIPSLARALAAQLLALGADPAKDAAVDSNPALTQRHRALIEALGRGQADPFAFSGEAAATLPEGAPWLELQLRPYGPLSRLTFLAERTEKGRRVRTYRAIHASGVVVAWTFSLDAEGRVVDFDLKEE